MNEPVRIAVVDNSGYGHHTPRQAASVAAGVDRISGAKSRRALVAGSV
jgi:hypothetical protein